MDGKVSNNLIILSETESESESESESEEESREESVYSTQYTIVAYYLYKAGGFYKSKIRWHRNRFTWIRNGRRS